MWDIYKDLMCGIAGYIFPNDKRADSLSSDTILKMTRSLKQRGPDGEGYYKNDNVALGHRRLSIIDLHKGKQPIFNEDNTICVLLNGEIYNYLELRKKLKEKGHCFTTNSDTEVIVHLYEEQGIKCLEELRGMFALIIYDISKKKLFLARDRYGIKPLYYFYENNILAFASEIKALRQFPQVEKDIDLEALNYYLTFESVPAPLTIYKKLKKLENGSFLLYQNGSLTKECYYQLSFSNKFTELNEDFYLDKIESLLLDSVKLHLESDVALGTFLSGGVDSSLITALACKLSSQKIDSFSIDFDEPSFDESKYSKRVSEYLGTNHRSKIFNTNEMLEILPTIFDYMDEPFADPSLLPTYLLSKYTKQNVTVALSGDGGDEVFAGYPTYYARKIAHFIPSFLYPILSPLANSIPVSHENISFDFKVKKFISGLPFSEDIRHQIWLGAFNFEQKRNLFSHRIKQNLGDAIDRLDIFQKYMNECDTEKNWERSLWADMRFYLQDNMLVKVDRASMMNSLEVRVPFLDHNLVEFVAKVPANIKYKGNISKHLLKRIAIKYLPRDIVQRNKKGFGIPIAKWIKKELKGEFLETLSTAQITKAGFFNPHYVQKLLDEHFNSKADHRKLLWTLYVFQKWYNTNW